MIDLTEEQTRQVLEILDRCLPGCPVWVYGSRGGMQAYRGSDLDLVLVGQDRLPLVALSRLRDEFEDSDLPFTVDLCDWNRLTLEFRNLIVERHEVLRGA